MAASQNLLRSRARHAVGLPKLLLFAALLSWLALMAGPAAAQDDRRTFKAPKPRALLATGPRTSPFDPPDKDVFVTDASPGLDTGCTFNDSPPLTIDVMVDRFVGDVDGNGYLVNPTPLISAGIIPASVEVLLPAYDIDFNGDPPPERDELLFNGESLGFLTGDNNVWKLNSFRVDIRKIKFPSRPAPGAAVTPVANRVTVRIDTLGVQRWCTSIDWVALVLPVRPKLGLQLDVVAGNPVASNTGTAITRIYEQKFDAACNVSEAIGPIEQYPFSGAVRSGTARLQATLKACPEGSLGTPEVTAEWAVGGTALKGAKKWSGATGVVEYAMPPTVGKFDATLKLTTDTGDSVNTTRRLFVTLGTPTVASPRVNWYLKGTEWANGQATDDGVVNSVLSGLYAYGNTAWRYGYFPGKCTWDQLMASPLACNYADCYVFSDVLQNISGVLGVSGLATIALDGSFHQGFLTTGSPSLDPAFRGNTKPLAGATYDKYFFSSHSLRKRGATYYDATFNGRYGVATSFIMANLTGTTGADANGGYYNTAEGRKLYPRPGNTYDSWGRNDYVQFKSPDFARLASLGTGPLVALAVSGATPMAGGTAISFPGTARYTPLVPAGASRAAQLAVDVDVDVGVAGDYALRASLEATNGTPISNRPAFDSMQFTGADLSGSAVGRRVVRLLFSGEQIRAAHIDGPWRVVLSANGISSAAGSGTLTTPAYRAADFGERKLAFSSFTATPRDADANGKFDAIRLSASVDVAEAGNYALQSELAAAGQGLASDARVVNLGAGTQAIVIDLPAGALARAGLDSPYDLTLNVGDANGGAIDSATTQLTGYLGSQFEPPVRLSPSPVEQLIDSNGNGLYELLRVAPSLTLGAASGAPRDVMVQARLVAANGASVEASSLANLATTPRAVNLDFPGDLIRSLGMNSTYRVELSFRSPATQQEFDALSFTLRGSYTASQFDPGLPVRKIALNGARSDAGQDTNANGLFDALNVTLGLDVLTAGSYDFSARLVDRNGAELGFATGRASLASGSGSITLRFDGRAIGVNGLDGPYFIRSLLVSSANGASLVAPFAGETSAWAANKFEGFVNRLPADLNGDGVVDEADLAAFNKALGSSLGQPNYNRFADYDRDGRITLNDLRFFRSYYRR